MNELEYNYTILKYQHDAAAGEVLNVGVALYCAGNGQVGILFDSRYARLSQAFAQFDGELYKRTMERLRAALERLSRPLAGNLFEIEERSRFVDVSALIRTVWPDQGTSYFTGTAFYGVSDDLDRELKGLYDRFVLSQFDRRASQERLDDEKLWDTFKKSLTPRGITDVLKPVTLGPAEVEFEHAYKNENWHVFEPLSLDYLEGSRIKQRAYELAGKASSVRELEEMGTFTVLLGKPRRIEGSKPYESARRILRDAPIAITLVEEDEAEAFAERLEREMREHKVLAANEP